MPGKDPCRPAQSEALPTMAKETGGGAVRASSQTLSVNEEKKERHCFQHEKMTLQQGTWSRNASLTHREGPN